MAEIYCTICGRQFTGSWLKSFLAGWVFKRVHGIDHIHCPDHAGEKIDGE